MTSSYGMTSPPYEAIVRRNRQEIGPIRLPQLQAERFIAEFNHTYRSLKLVICDIRTPILVRNDGSNHD